MPAWAWAALLVAVGFVHVRGIASHPLVREELRLALGTLIALPTTMTFLGLAVLVVLGRSVTALGFRVLAAKA